MRIKLETKLSTLIERELEGANEINRKKDLPYNNYLKVSLSGNESFRLELLQNKFDLGEFKLDDIPELKTPFKFNNQFIAEYNCEELNLVTFVDLHGHTGYSLLDGMNKIKDFVGKTVYSRAITDHGVMYGCVDFFKTMKKNHKKPILGFEAYTETIDGEAKKRHLVLLAKSEQGYKNLCILSTLGCGNLDGKFPKRPTLKYEWLREYSEGIICLSACIGGEIPQNFLKGNDDKAIEVAKEFKSIFGEDFYLEIQRHNIEEEIIVNKKVIELGKMLDIKVIATTDTHYLNKEDSLVHEIHLCNQTKTTLDNPKRYKFKGDGYHVHTIEEMEEKFKDIPEVLYNSLEVMEKCDFNFEFGNYKMPLFPVPKGMTEAEYLEKITWEGFNERFPVGTEQHTSKEYRDRIRFELDTIFKMEYPAYFLIVWDFVKYSKDNGYPLGPGRGSACGSLVSYCLKITEIDPIPYNLLFERFLNPDRKSMPDIDQDFGNLIREDVIDYCREKYGESAVSRIITFSTLSAKAVVKDVARIVFSNEPDKKLGDLISKTIPNKPKMTLKKAFELSPEFEDLYNKNNKVKQVVDYAIRLEGLPKACSQHACGVIIADKDIKNYCPQTFLEDKKTGIIAPTTQYTMSECEEVGLLKMDFLGLKTMTVLDENVNDINEIYGKNMTIEDIPINDPFTYENIAKGKTVGVFQLESPGMTSFMSKLFQDVSKKIHEIDKKSISDSDKEKGYAELGDVLFERLIAGISLYRPGPMDGVKR